MIDPGVRERDRSRYKDHSAASTAGLPQVVTICPISRAFLGTSNEKWPNKCRRRTLLGELRHLSLLKPVPGGCAGNASAGTQIVLRPVLHPMRWAIQAKWTCAARFCYMRSKSPEWR